MLRSADPSAGLASGGSFSQPGTSIALAGQGRGFALSDDGNARLHLRLDSGLGFDSNPYRLPFSDSRFGGDAIFRLRPTMELLSTSAGLAWNASAFFDYGLLPGVINPATENLFLFQSAAKAGLEVNRGAALSFAFADSLSWNNTPGVVNLGSMFNRVTNDFNAGLGFRPGGGALTLKLSYLFQFQKWFDFVPSASSLAATGVLDTMLHSLTFRTDWRLFPRTGLFFLASAGVNSFPFDNGVNPISFPVGAQIGLMGQFTPKLSGLVSLGYQNPLVLDTDETNNLGIVTAEFIGVAGQAEVRWMIAPTMQLAGGFSRNVGPAPLYQFVTNNRFYLKYDQSLSSRLVVSANAGFGLLEFGEEQPVDGEFITTVPKGRLDGQLNARAQLRYYLMEWFSFGLTNNLEWRMTPASSVNGGNLSYLTNETLVLASVHY